MTSIKQRFLIKRREKIINYLNTKFDYISYSEILNDSCIIINLYNIEENRVITIYVSLLIRVTNKRLKEIELRLKK